MLVDGYASTGGMQLHTAGGMKRFFDGFFVFRVMCFLVSSQLVCVGEETANAKRKEKTKKNE